MIVSTSDKIQYKCGSVKAEQENSSVLVAVRGLKNVACLLKLPNCSQQIQYLFVNGVALYLLQEEVEVVR